MLVYPDKKNKKQPVADGAQAEGNQSVLRVIALIIAFISVFGFFFKILFF